MAINLNWTGPFRLVNGAQQHLIYGVQNIDKISEGPGVYVFSRAYADKVEPLYIGKAVNVRARIAQHLKNNVSLMTKMKNKALNGQRVLYVGVLDDHQGMDEDKAIEVAERALISAAIFEGYELFNQQGTKKPVYTIKGSGRMDARRWWPNQKHLEVPR
jgi:predicted GIY-YIG superfamily endonuclease